jgi:carboxylesterase type B
MHWMIVVGCTVTGASLPPFFAETDKISEDCLTLRIARPAGTISSSRLPVVVWVHGGGVVKGSAYDPHFDPDQLIKLSKSLQSPILYVALNYRITSFGFASLTLLKKQNVLNVGMKDQEAGFEWIRDNIEAFGGDPTTVTAYGLIAGGTMSSLHLVAKRDKPPFTQLWTMSGPPGSAHNIRRCSYVPHTSGGRETPTEPERRRSSTEVPTPGSHAEALRGFDGILGY